ncbi:MAG: hypothetical protein RLZZ153_699 [Pseudomonadota bacterium]|jgi:hypothetical protein
MSLAFHLDVDSNQPGTRLKRIAAGLGALGTVALALGLINADLKLWSLIVLGLGLALTGWVGFRPGIPGPVGLLEVDAAGAVKWSDGRGLSVPARASSWRRGSSLVWLQLQDPSQHRLDLLISRRQCTDQQWSALARWLLWLERGSSD